MGIYSQFVDRFVETIYTRYNLAASLVQRLVSVLPRFLSIPYLVGTIGQDNMGNLPSRNEWKLRRIVIRS